MVSIMMEDFFDATAVRSIAAGEQTKLLVLGIIRSITPEAFSGVI